MVFNLYIRIEPERYMVRGGYINTTSVSTAEDPALINDKERSSKRETITVITSGLETHKICLLKDEKKKVPVRWAFGRLKDPQTYYNQTTQAKHN